MGFSQNLGREIGIGHKKALGTRLPVAMERICTPLHLSCTLCVPIRFRNNYITPVLFKVQFRTCVIEDCGISHLSTALSQNCG